MPANEFDPPSDYRTFRVEAARKIELWIQKDARVLSTFRDRIQFAGDLYQAWEKKNAPAKRRRERLWKADRQAALKDPRRRDKAAGPPGSDYEWQHCTSYDPVNRPTEEDFHDLQEEGLVGTWEDIQRAWTEKRWGYWRRKCPDALYDPWPWKQIQRDGAEQHFLMPGDRAERMRIYYCLLAAIHDKDLETGPTITQDIWPDLLLHYVHLEFWGGYGDKTLLVRTALECVEQDLAPIVSDHEEKGAGGQRTPNQKPGGKAQASDTCAVHDRVFISYSRKDEKWLSELLNHLKPYTRNELLTTWSDKDISSGEEWFTEIKAALASTKVGVLLVTKDFLASDFIAQHERKPLLEQAKQGKVQIIWIPVGACSYEQTELKDCQAPIDPAKPIANMKKPDRDKAWVKICEAINKAVGGPSADANTS